MHQTDSDELLEMFLTSITTSFDPHTHLHVARARSENFENHDAAEAGRHRRAARS